MALSKNITSREGVTTTYHKISEVLLEDGAYIALWIPMFQRNTEN